MPASQAQNQGQEGTLGSAGSSPQSKALPESSQIQGHLLPALTVQMGKLRHGRRETQGLNRIPVLPFICAVTLSKSLPP